MPKKSKEQLAKKAEYMRRYRKKPENLKKRKKTRKREISSKTS